MTNQPTEQPEHKRSGHYEGKFSAKKKEKKKHRFPLGIRILFTVLIVLACLVAALAATYFILRATGHTKSHIVDPDTVISFPQNTDEGKEVVVQKDDKGRVIEYNGHTYELNENLTTLLFMGVDTTITDDPRTPGQAGQADVILLIVMDTETGHTKTLCFPRDSYAEVDLYSTGGTFLRTDHTQLCLAFAYGDQHELSCENMIASVERFLYGIQISSYVALDMNGILVANDSIGGVTLTSLDDIQLSRGHSVKKGEEITLLGDEADSYIRSRSHEDIDANVARMARQKQYCEAFASTVLHQAKGDPFSLVNLFQSLSPYMVTNVGLDTVSYLAPIALKGGLSFEDFHTIESTIDMVDGYPMYYLDEADLQDSIVNTFYTQID